MTSSLTQAPTTLEIQHRFAEILSAGPLCLEDIADKLHPFGQDHEDAVVAVFSDIVERIQEDGVERFGILPEYAIHVSTETKGSGKIQVKHEDRDTASLPPFPSDTIQRHDSASISSTPSLPPPPPPSHKMEPDLSSPPTSSLSSPPSTPSAPPSPSPPPSSTLSSPPATPDLRTPSPEPARPSKRKNAPSSRTKEDDDSPKKKRKRVAKKKENMQRVQCSGISKNKKTQCRFQKMVGIGETWDCGRHGRGGGGEKKKKKKKKGEVETVKEPVEAR